MSRRVCPSRSARFRNATAIGLVLGAALLAAPAASEAAGGLGGADAVGNPGGAGGGVSDDWVGEAGQDASGAAGGGGGGPGAPGGRGGGDTAGGSGGANGSLLNPVGQDGGAGTDSVDGEGGGGGGGGGHGYVGSVIPDATEIRGGDGGSGANVEFDFDVDNPSHGGGGGGAGGYGAVISDGGTAEIEADQTIAGGRGGDGGERGWIQDSVGGSGGVGGIGLVFSGDTLRNHGTISGGDGGEGLAKNSGLTSGADGGDGLVFSGVRFENGATGSIQGGDGTWNNQGGAGGDGVIFEGEVLVNAGTIAGGKGVRGRRWGGPGGPAAGGNGITFTGQRLHNTGSIQGGDGSSAGGSGIRVERAGAYLINEGTIAGGSLNTGGGQAPAVDFAGGGGNRLEIRPGAVFAGDVVAAGADNRLILGGSGSGSFDAGEIGGAYRGFDAFHKTGDSDWTVTGAGGQDWTVESGRLVMTGAQTGGFTLHEAATLDVSGGSLAVGAGHRLAGRGRIVGDATLADGSRLAPGASLGTLTVDGDLTFESGARFEVEVDPTSGDSDRLAVTGTARLGGEVVHVGLAGDYAVASRHRILTAGAVEGTFDGVSSDFHFLDSDLMYGADFVDLSLRRNDRGFAQFARSPNQRATATAIEALGPGDPLHDAIVTQAGDPAALRQAYDQLSGDHAAALQRAMSRGTRTVQSLAQSRLRGVVGGGQTAGRRPTSDPRAAQQASRVQVAAAPAATAGGHSLPGRAWGQVFGAWGESDGDGNAAASERDTQGFLFGVDGALGDGWTLGALAGLSRTQVDSDARNASSEIDSYHLGLYAGRAFAGVGPGELALTTGLTVSWHEIDSRRAVTFQGFADSPSAEHSARSYQVYGELGYRLDEAASGLPLALEPYAALSYLHHRSDGYSETGGGAALTREAEGDGTLSSTLGLRAAAQVEAADRSLKLSGGLGWRHAYGDRAVTVSQRFGDGQTFTVAGAPLARDSAVIDLGVGVDLGARARLTATYDGQLSGDDRDHGARLDLSIRF